MEKIGILTFQNAINYGGVLQCYALQEFCNMNGINAEIIDYDSENINKHNAMILKNGIKTSPKTIIKNLLLFPFNFKRKVAYDRFIKSNLKLSRKIKKEEFEKFCNNNYSHVIVGSDQVWNKEIVGGEEDIYFLKNLKCKKISYAASTGNNNQKNLKNIVDLTKDFSDISVREESTKDLLKKEFEYDVKTNIDPTLLLDSSKWSELVTEGNEQKYVLIYSLQEDYLIKKIVDKITEATDCKEKVTFSKKSFGIDNIKRISTSGPKEFLTYFKNSEYVITNSFHGTAFSIIFKKKFLVLLPKTRSERILSLLEKLNLKDRIIYNEEEINEKLNSEIDYEKVNNLINFEIEKAKLYLKEITNKC